MRQIGKNTIELTLLVLLIILLIGCGSTSDIKITGNGDPENIPSATGTAVDVPVEPSPIESKEDPSRIPPLTVVSTTLPVTVSPAIAVPDTGAIEPCRLPIAAFSNVGLGIPRPSGFTPSTGIVEEVVLFVDFADAPANETPEETFGRVSPGALISSSKPRMVV